MNVLRGRNRNWTIGLLLVLLLSTGCGLMGNSSNEADLVERGDDVSEAGPTAVPTPSPPPPVTDTILAEPLPPLLYLTNLGQDELHGGQPAHLRLELVGTAVTSLTLQIGQYDEADNLTPLSRQPLLNQPPADGIHRWQFTWYGDVLPADDEQDEQSVDEFQEQTEPFLPPPAPPAAEPSLSREPLPPGRYQLALEAANEAGTAVAALDLTLTEPEEPMAGRLYFDPQHAFQFQYPYDWQTPVYSGTLLLSRHVTTTAQMQLIRWPDLPPGSNQAALADQALAQFGPVSRLYQDQLTVADRQAQRIAYGYTRADGAERTGVLIAFVRQGQGFVLDVEGAAEAETAVWQTAELMATSWQFVAPAADLPLNWIRQPVADLMPTHPGDYTYQEVRGWHRFSRDRDTFWALRTDGVAAADVVELDRRLQDAGAGVDDFGAGRPYYFVLDGQRWLRADFSYSNSRQEQIQGAILLSVVGGQPLIVWLEAPLNEFAAVEEAHFLRMLIEVVRGA